MGDNREQYLVQHEQLFSSTKKGVSSTKLDAYFSKENERKEPCKTEADGSIARYPKYTMQRERQNFEFHNFLMIF